MQLAQSLRPAGEPPLATQNCRHLPTFTCQRRMPGRLETEVSSRLRSPRGMAWTGQAWAQVVDEGLHRARCTLAQSLLEKLAH